MIDWFRSSSAHYVLLTLTVGLLLCTGTADLPLIDRDEPRFAEAARQMAERSNWIIPYFNEAYRFDKPPMSYWLMGLSASLTGGFSEFSARLPAVISAGLVGLMIYRMGCRRLEPATGLWAAMAWLVSVQVLIHGRLAVADMPLIAAITASTWALWELLTREDAGPSWRLMLYLSLGFGFLAKGPLAFICPLLTVGLYRLMWRQPLPLKRLGLRWGLPWVVGLIGLWGIPALYLTDGLFWQQGMGHHVVERGITPLNGRGFTPFFYLASTFFSLYPGIAWLGGTLRRLRESWHADTVFLLAWLLGPYLLFSFYATQLSHYVLPAFPAAVLLLARTATAPHRPDHWQRAGFAIVTGGGFLVTVLLLLIGFGETFTPAMMPLRHFVLALAAMAGGLTLLAWFTAGRRYRVALVTLIAVGAGLSAGSHSLRSVAPTVALAPLFADLPPQTVCHAVGFEEPGLVYYSHRHWLMGAEAGGTLEQTIATPGPRVILLQQHETRLEAYLARYLPFIRKPVAKPEPERRKQWVRQLQAPDSGFRVEYVTGINPARLSWVELMVAIRTG